MDPSGIRRQYRGQSRWDGAETEKGRFLELDEAGVIAKRSSTYTICALSDLGALDPNQTLPRPDLQGRLWHLFARNRWTQIGKDFYYNLDGRDRLWNVEVRIWGHMIPLHTTFR
ncbi:hypothetical protein FJTKL_04152 [Diaporthe vaccinii]|uniref:Uncharacterized protein n=1 Tax=Diaporthe vaccinii TaxID=105482 RepID=A0ABR4DTJ8_9PEZI